ncbi:hypothetical protein EHQ12_03985 [Leptospira gomenensis]|uniref:Uncharacterized protein n=1 Tax=Leptospira gomenensis TaxID=2484974 RepID=A0A5F1YDT2_9LEPT|nr:hypothetical protein [Leptospira gomenensis]TGK36166.1 hypothetical protein EHQ17_04425 [Leptospira gomenensis]TGK42794.1 hypothetical protein EHQ07_14065 [Leptospira gomenensis]TGK42927.1 hypothetical protein EHQ12_03985 [Leptospira gomenensis]TGK54939.1 hypothetical protein EHQ13_18240 [Leptospira gomenensis]
MSEDRLYQFRAEPFKVTLIRPDGTAYPIPTYDGTGIFRAAQLDRITEDYQRKTKEIDDLKGEIKPFSKLDATKLNPEQADLLDRFRKAGIEISRYYFDYCKAALPDLERHLPELDLIPKDQINVFVTYLVTATLGGDSGKPEVAPKTPEEYVKKNRKNRRKKKRTKFNESSQMNGSADGNTQNRK